MLDDEDINIMKQAIREFEKEHMIVDIVLLGHDGAIRRIRLRTEKDGN